LRERLTQHLAAQGLLVSTNPDAALAQAGANRGLVGAVSDELRVDIDGEPHVAQFFAEALVVPEDRWDEVRSLREFEQGDQPPVVGPHPPKPSKPGPAPLEPPSEEEPADPADSAMLASPHRRANPMTHDEP
jgi:hypothetical protein